MSDDADVAGVFTQVAKLIAPLSYDDKVRVLETMRVWIGSPPPKEKPHFARPNPLSGASR